MWRAPHFTLSVLITSGILSSTAAAPQEVEIRPAPPSIRVTGEGVTRSMPDEARIDVGVISSADTAKAAAAANARQTDAVLDEIRKLIGQRGEVRTVGFSVAPSYRYPKEGGKPSIAGYTVTNSVQVRTTGLDLVGSVIDAATASGANAIQRLEFGLQDPSGARNAALRQASQAARTKAQAIADALGTRITRILRVEESSTTPQPIQERMLMAAAPAGGVPTPVEPGTIEVHAAVTLTVEIAGP